MQDIIRIAASVPSVSVGDCEKNLAALLVKADEAEREGARIAVFPELAITGYTCGELFLQETLLASAASALLKAVEHSAGSRCVSVIGLPLEIAGRLYNCAAVIADGRLCGIVPKTHIPNYGEFYEARWFSSAALLDRKQLEAEELGLPEQHPAVPVGNELVFDTGDFTFGVEVCEDLWATVPPSNRLALGGAEIILNPSASNETVAKRGYRRSLTSSRSSATLTVYAYTSSGSGESTGDLVFSGHALICENGRLLAENRRIADSDHTVYADADLGKIRAERRRVKTFADCAALSGVEPCRRIKISLPSAECNDLKYYSLEKLPFVPNTETDRLERCEEIFEIQAAGLKKRLEITGARPVIGVSGGLDSTLALLVSAEALRQLGRPASDAVGITMPCFGTTDRTHSNSLELMKTVGITSLEIPIADAVTGHFADIGHDGKTTDLTYENSQARERTQVLMDYAGRINGLVVGTGDLSELALGWCTYNADHMSMYGVNCGIPKTLVRWMIDSISRGERFASSRAVLADILDTPISPELLPPDASGKTVQHTEELVGPYALHDFFLFYTVRYGFSPEKVFALARKAFAADFTPEVIKKWLTVFYRRFFSQQYKRSCQPDGVKVGSICLSPRGDWRMPSDASAAEWLKRAEAIQI